MFAEVLAGGGADCPFYSWAAATRRSLLPQLENRCSFSGGGGSRHVGVQAAARGCNFRGASLVHSSILRLAPDRLDCLSAMHPRHNSK